MNVRSGGKNGRGPGRRRPRRGALLLAAYCGALALLMLLAAEVSLRFNGLTPWKRADEKFRVDPDASLYVKDPRLGYAPAPGRFTITLADGYAFTVTHLPERRRATRLPGPGDPQASQGEIWIFGCSYTYGWSVSDRETYPWLLQERLPGYEVRNFAVSGYGTVQALLQLRAQLERARPKVAIVAYAAFHDPRNTLLRGRLKEVEAGNRLGPLLQTRARLDEQGRLRLETLTIGYRPLPLQSRLALVNFIDDYRNSREDRRYHSREVSQALIAEMARVAAANGTRFVLALIAGDRGLPEYAAAHGIPWVDISVDLRLEGNRNLPHDAHPSAAAHAQYADALAGYLRATVLQESPPR